MSVQYSFSVTQYFHPNSLTRRQLSHPIETDEELSKDTCGKPFGCYNNRMEYLMRPAMPDGYSLSMWDTMVRENGTIYGSTGTVQGFLRSRGLSLNLLEDRRVGWKVSADLILGGKQTLSQMSRTDKWTLYCKSNGIPS